MHRTPLIALNIPIGLSISYARTGSRAHTHMDAAHKLQELQEKKRLA